MSKTIAGPVLKIDLIKTELNKYGAIAPTNSPKKIRGSFKDVLPVNLALSMKVSTNEKPR